jgi:hypothetical protein
MTGMSGTSVYGYTLLALQCYCALSVCKHKAKDHGKMKALKQIGTSSVMWACCELAGGGGCSPLVHMEECQTNLHCLQCTANLCDWVQHTLCGSRVCTKLHVHCSVQPLLCASNQLRFDTSVAVSGLYLYKVDCGWAMKRPKSCGG